MLSLKFMAGSAAALAALSLAVPAEAQRHRPRHHHRGDRVDGGSLLLGGLIVGGIVALAHGEKKRRDREAAYYADYEAEPAEEGGAPVPVEGSSPVPDLPAPYASDYDGLYDVEAATDRCAAEAETIGQNYARLSRVASVSDQLWNGKSWVIKGRIELAEGYGDTSRETRKFRCALKAGSEPRVTIEGL
jgi:hypothetical protein